MLQALYEYAKELFERRHSAAMAARHVAKPASFECADDDCGVHVNAELYAESPLFAYRNAQSKPWHLLCRKKCVRKVST